MKIASTEKRSNFKNCKSEGMGLISRLPDSVRVLNAKVFSVSRKAKRALINQLRSSVTCSQIISELFDRDAGEKHTAYYLQRKYR